MTTADLIKHHLTRSPLIAVAVYLGLMTALATATWGALADVLERRAEVTAARDTLAQMERRKPAPVQVVNNNASDNGAIVPPGSAFLEGPTVTVGPSRNGEPGGTIAPLSPALFGAWTGAGLRLSICARVSRAAVTSARRSSMSASVPHVAVASAAMSPR